MICPIPQGDHKKKKDRNSQLKNIMFASAKQGGHKNRDAQKKRFGYKVRGLSPEAVRESVVRKICERGRS